MYSINIWIVFQAFWASKLISKMLPRLCVFFFVKSQKLPKEIYTNLYLTRCIRHFEKLYFSRKYIFNPLVCQPICLIRSTREDLSQSVKSYLQNTCKKKIRISEESSWDCETVTRHVLTCSWSSTEPQK